MIRLIHQTWKTTAIPDGRYFPEWRQSWADLNPGWETRFWTDEDNEALVATHYPSLRPFYHAVDRGVIRADIARALYLHRHGGLYVDLDFACLRPMEELLAPLGDRIVLGRHGQPRQPVPNAWMYSPPGHYFWLSFLGMAARAWYAGARAPESVAGPNTLLRALRHTRDVHVLPEHQIYPFVWGNHSHALYAKEIDWRSLDSLRAAYPGAYAVTSWAHGW